MSGEEEPKRKRNRSRSSGKKKKKKRDDENPPEAPSSAADGDENTAAEAQAPAAARSADVADDDERGERKERGERNLEEEGTPGVGFADGGRENEEDEEDPQPSKRKRKRKRKKKSALAEAGSAKGVGASSPSDGAQEEKLASTEHTVYVEGIPFDCSEEDVREFFVGHGCVDVLQMRLSRWQDTGRLRGFGHIVFDTVESRARALKELNGLNLGRRYLTIKEPNAPRPGTAGAARTVGVKPREQPEGCSTVFVKNLPYDAAEEEVHDAFRPCGKIVEGGVRLVRNSVTKRSKGFAYVEFKNPEGAFAAMHRAAKPFGMSVKGRPCFVDYEEGMMKGSFRTADGRLWQKEHRSTHSGIVGGARR